MEENLMIFSQSLLRQVALPLDLHLQRLGHVRYDPFDRSQHKKNYMLGMEKDKERLNITASWKSVDMSRPISTAAINTTLIRMTPRTISLLFYKINPK